MSGLPVGDLVPLLQVAIGPVILVSRVGWLLLRPTNRPGRILDRSPALSRELRSTPPSNSAGLRLQLEILAGRARLLQRAIILATLSVLFLTAMLGPQTAWRMVGLFAGCILTLIGSLRAFIDDLSRSRAALKLELGQSRPGTRIETRSEDL